MTVDLASSSNFKQFDDEVSALIRGERHHEAERLLKAQLTKYPSPAASLIHDLGLDAVQVEGWPAFNERIEALSATGKPITAAWLHLSNYTDDSDDGLRHPVVELGYLRDGRIAFSETSTDELLELSGAYPAPWTGSPDEDGHELEIKGLERLNDWLLKFEMPEAHPNDPTLRASMRIAEWFLLLRYHQAVRGKLAKSGLSRDIPLIVGAHDVGSWCMAVYRRTKPFVIDRARKPTKKEQEELRHSIEYQVGVWQSKRADTEHYFGPFGSERYLKEVIDKRHMAERWFKDTPFEGLYPLEMRQADFDRFIEGWKHFRDPSTFAAPPPPEKLNPPPPPPSGPSVMRRLFGRKGL
ncbi:MAG TPA: hypothetical protein VEZ70_01190 [Allosphingosinicella sp.]|nr:hypothetical protein [Allosphingosinicella sp.]